MWCRRDSTSPPIMHAINILENNNNNNNLATSMGP
jgi:hypothetical protein